MVALLSGMYRNSQRMVQSGMADLFGISMSLGSVNKLRLEASKAVANCVYEAKQYVQQQACVGRTKQAFTRVDGCNPEERQAMGCGHTP